MKTRTRVLLLLLLTGCVCFALVLYLRLPNLLEQFDASLRERLQLEELDYTVEDVSLTSITLSSLSLRKHVSKGEISVAVETATVLYSWRILLGSTALRVEIPSLELQFSEDDSKPSSEAESEEALALVTELKALFGVELPDIDLAVDLFTLYYKETSNEYVLEQVDLRTKKTFFDLSFAYGGNTSIVPQAVSVAADLKRQYLVVKSRPLSEHSDEQATTLEATLEMNSMNSSTSTQAQITTSLDLSRIMVEPSKAKGRLNLETKLTLSDGDTPLRVLAESSLVIHQLAIGSARISAGTLRVTEDVVFDSSVLFANESYMLPSGQLVFEKGEIVLPDTLAGRIPLAQVAINHNGTLKATIERLELSTKDLKMPTLSVIADLAITAESIRGTVSAEDRKRSLKGNGTIAYPLASNAKNSPRVTFSLSEQSAQSLLEFLAAANVYSDRELAIVAGKVNVQYSYKDRKGQVSQGARIGLKSLKGRRGDFRFDGLSGQIHFPALPQVTTDEKSYISVVQLSNGIALNDVRCDFRLKEVDRDTDIDDVELVIRDLDAAFAGGRLKNQGGRYLLKQKRGALALQVEGVDLQALLALYPQSAVAASGTLNGVIPLQLRPTGVLVDAGVLRSSSGVIRVNEATRSSLRQGIGPATQVLENYRYTELQTGATFEESGKLLLAIELKGRNPDFQDGRPVHLHLSIDEDIPALIKSLRMTNSIVDSVTPKQKSKPKK